MLASHSGLIVKCRRGAVIIMAPLSSTALGMCGHPALLFGRVRSGLVQDCDCGRRVHVQV